jgi:hypothetical protein
MRPLYSGRERSDDSKFSIFHLKANLQTHTKNICDDDFALHSTTHTSCCNASKTRETTLPTASSSWHKAQKTNRQCWSRYCRLQTLCEPRKRNSIHLPPSPICESESLTTFTNTTINYNNNKNTCVLLMNDR